jgi:uncharacterized protein YprB with RNaseH-like and TPR domain
MTYFTLPDKSSITEEEIYESIAEIQFKNNASEKPLKFFMDTKTVGVRGHDRLKEVETLFVEKKTSLDEVVEILASFSHYPYKPFKLTGSFEEKGSSIKCTALKSWENNIKIEEAAQKVLFFDIETEVNGSIFPKGTQQDITCISYAIDDGQTKVLTMIPKAKLEENKDNDLSYVEVYNKQMEMIDTFIKIMIECDKTVSYNGYGFDIPFIVDVVERYYPEYWEKLSKNDGRHIRPELKRFENSFGENFHKTISIPGVEHVDLLPVLRRIFPFWSNHKLDTAGKELLGKRKVNFPMRKYKAVTSEYMKARDEKRDMSDESLELLLTMFKYSRVDTILLQDIYTYMGQYRNISTSNCGLTCETWCTSSEIDGVTEILFPNKVFAKNGNNFSLDKGFYSDVGIYVFKSIALKSIKNTKLLNYIKRTNILAFPNFYNQIFFIPELFDHLLYIANVNRLIERSKHFKYVGSNGAYIYISGVDEKFSDDSCYKYDSMIIPTKTSWISLNIDSEMMYDLSRKGYADICRPMPQRLDYIFSKEVAHIRDQDAKGEKLKMSIPEINSQNIFELLFSEGSQFSIGDFTYTKLVREYSPRHLQKYLTEEEMNSLDTGASFISINLIYTTEGLKRVTYPYAKDMEIDAEHYVDVVTEHFKTLQQITGAK